MGQQNVDPPQGGAMDEDVSVVGEGDPKAWGVPHWQQDQGTQFVTFRLGMIRDAAHFTNALKYIRNNPVRARLRDGAYTLWEDRTEPGGEVELGEEGQHSVDLL